MHTRVFVALGHDECLRRRIERDVRERGRTRHEVATQYASNVRPMYDRYVASTRDHAQLVLDGRIAIDALAERILSALEAPAPD
jgi:uridine kinase